MGPGPSRSDRLRYEESMNEQEQRITKALTTLTENGDLEWTEWYALGGTEINRYTCHLRGHDVEALTNNGEGGTEWALRVWAGDKLVFEEANVSEVLWEAIEDSRQAAQLDPWLEAIEREAEQSRIDA